MKKRKAIEYNDYLSLEQDKITYIVDKTSAEKNSKSYENIKALLDKAGIDFNVQNQIVGGKNEYTLSIKIRPEEYLRNQRRFAGPNINPIRFKDNKIGLAGESIHYSDIVLMLQSMTDKEIMETLSIPNATYYRHKKKMLESHYYKIMDKNRLTDELYLKGDEGLCLYDDCF